MNKQERLIRKRYLKEVMFKYMGLSAVLIAMAFLSILIGSIFVRGVSGFSQTYINLEVDFKQNLIDPSFTREKEVIFNAKWRKITKESIYNLQGINPTTRKQKKDLANLFSSGTQYFIRDYCLKNLEIIGNIDTVKILASSEVDQYLKGKILTSTPEEVRALTNEQILWIEKLKDDNLIEQRWNLAFFKNGDSRNSEEAGILGALIGSGLVILVTLILSFPVGVMAAIYLEEFAPKNKITDIIEVNINNLAAVPSIVFGLLGLSIFLNFFGLPRSAPIAGGLVLSLMTLPTIIISSRSAMKSVPPSIREGAMAVGASKMQSILHHVIPLAFPGMLTGTIIGLARALGETAPLLMMGMVAFIVDIPNSISDPSTILPAQIYLWSDQPEKGFVEKTASATLVLLVFLLFMNAFAVYLRNKFEKKW